MEQMYEEALSIGNTTGAIFALKNFGWVDKQNIDLGDSSINITVVENVSRKE